MEFDIKMPPGKTCVSEELYTIEKILEHRIREDGEFEYRVKWEVCFDLDFWIFVFYFNFCDKMTIFW